MTDSTSMLNRVTEAFRAEVASKKASTNDDKAASLWDGILADVIAQDKAEEEALAEKEAARQQALLATVTDEQRARIAARRAERKF